MCSDACDVWPRANLLLVKTVRVREIYNGGMSGEQLGWMPHHPLLLLIIETAIETTIFNLQDG